MNWDFVATFSILKSGTNRRLWDHTVTATNINVIQRPQYRSVTRNALCLIMMCIISKQARVLYAV